MKNRVFHPIGKESNSMSIPRADLEALVHGPIETAGIIITPKGKRIWSDNLSRENGLKFQSRMLRKLVNKNGEPCNGVYFHCIKDRVNVHSRIEEGNIRLDVLLNNTCFHGKLDERFPRGIDGMETIQKYSGMKRGVPKFVKIVGESGKMILGCELGEGKKIETYGPKRLDPEIPNLAQSEIGHGSRILKIGMADRRSGIQGRINEYRRGFQASITKYCYGYANNVFQKLELFIFDIDEFNDLLTRRRIQNLTPKTPENLERDLLKKFSSVHGSLPPWEQQHRYATARDGIPDPSYHEILSELLDVIENPRKKEE